MHQHSFSQGLSSFFERLPHRFGTDALHYLAFNQPVRQQFKCPTYPALWRFGAGQGNQVGFPLTVQFLLTAVQPLLAPQICLNTFFYAAAAHPFHGGSAYLEGPANLLVFHGPAPAALIAQQQDASVSLLIGRCPPLGHQLPQFLLLLLRQLHPVFLHLHHPLTSQSSFVTTRYDTPATHHFKAVGLLVQPHVKGFELTPIGVPQLQNIRIERRP